jgi:hypothetical protein
VWERHEHFVVGYDAETLTRLFPGPLGIHGTYWRDSGVAWREGMQNLSRAKIERQADDLKAAARKDLIARTPARFEECQGIKILSDIREHKRAGT